MLLLKFISVIVGYLKQWLFSGLGLVLFVCCWFSLQSSENRLGETLLSLSALCFSQSEVLSQGHVVLTEEPH